MSHFPAVPTGTSVALSIAKSTPSVVAEVPVAEIPITVPISVPISTALPVPSTAAASVEEARRQRSAMHPRMRKANFVKSRLWMEIVTQIPRARDIRPKS